jgi:hypothetical protein
VARRRIEIYAYRQVLMRLRQGDSEREIAHSGLQKTADHTLQESGLLWDGENLPEPVDGLGEWKVGRDVSRLFLGV